MAEPVIIGMSSPRRDWATRLRQVGPEGVTARRIFAWLNSSGSDQMDLVGQAHDAGMTPVYSFKVPNVSDAKAGKYDAWVNKTVENLGAYRKQTTVTFHHEPYGDMSGADFVAVNKRYAPLIQKDPNLRFGPFVNGWLLDNKQSVFTSFTSKELLGTWSFMGIDTYESGTMNTPGRIKPADRIPKLMAWLKTQGVADKPIGIGEYNGYSGKTIAAAGEAILSCPNMWFACMWNATTGKGYVLEGERLAAFKKTKADARVRK